MPSTKKPIEFEKFAKTTWDGTSLVLYAEGNIIKLRVADCTTLHLPKVDELRELQAAIGRAADALEKSRSTLFSELAIGETFRHVDDHLAPFAARIKTDLAREMYFTKGAIAVETVDALKPVIRLTATFEEVPNE